MRSMHIDQYVRTGLLALAGAALLHPCYAAKVRTQLGVNTDFSHYKTYRWLPPKALTKTGVVENDPVIAPAIKDAVNRQLTQHGLTEVTQGGDLEVASGVLNEFIPQVEAVLFAGPDLMYDTPIATMGRYNRQGTLVVNLIDTKTKKSAWVGMVQDSIDNKPGAGLKKLPSAAEKLFKKFPETSKK